MTDAQNQIIGLLKEIRAASGGGGGASISDAAYGVGWNGDTTNGASKNALYDKIEAVIASIPTAPYLVYTALLMQSGTDAPVPTVLQNTLGEVPTYTYIGTGNYGIVSPGELFIANKTTIETGLLSTAAGRFGISCERASLPVRFELTTFGRQDEGAALDGALVGTKVEIRVYP